MAPTDRRNIRCVGGVVHDATGRLLLIRRGHPPAEGRWSLPGGRVEAGETDQQAVMRELFEETALRVDVRQWCGSVTIPPYEIHDYRCVVTEGEASAGDDAADVLWADAATFRTLDQSDQLTTGLAGTLRKWGL